jgi:hypothetical protein
MMSVDGRTPSSAAIRLQQQLQFRSAHSHLHPLHHLSINGTTATLGA